MRGGAGARSAGVRVVQSLLLLAAGTLAALVVVEIGYRRQWIDTYRPELRFYNDPAELAGSTGRERLLVAGDSMTAGRITWATLLRAAQDRYDVINSAVSGTGVVQARIVAPGRFARFDPAIFVYQVFVGNDLFDIRYPVRWGALSPARNLYWTAADRLRSLAFLNYRLGQLRAGRSRRDEDAPAPPRPAGTARPGPPSEATVTPREILADPERWIDRSDFSRRRYTKRIRRYLRAEPSLLEDQILVQGERRRDYDLFLRELEELLALCRPERCRAHVLVIPDASQVDRRYLENARALGARFAAPERVLADDYPFLERLRRHLAESGSPARVLDPAPALRRHEREGRPVYFQNDLHLSPYGQAVLAAFVREELGL